MASALLLFIIIIIICVSMHLFLVHRNPNFVFDMAMPSVSFEDIFFLLLCISSRRDVLVQKVTMPT